MTVEELKNKVLQDVPITQAEAEWLATQPDKEALYEAAHEITAARASQEFDMCSIINAKSGRCPENCKWCAQSAHHHTQIETYDAIPIHEAISIARLNEQQGIKRLSLVTSGRRIKASEIDYFCDIYRKMGEETHLHLCASMGLLKREELEKLKAAGVKRYHCNLETASSYFSELCTTHTIEQKKETIRTAQELGMEICSGGIIGMGETMRQRIELAFENHRFYDVRRWKIMEETDKCIYGLNISATRPLFYQVIKTEDRPHDFKYYLWPIPQSEIYKNKRLVQNPGWQAID